MSVPRGWLRSKTTIEEVKKEWEDEAKELKININQRFWDALDDLRGKMIEGDELWKFRSDEGGWRILAGREGIVLIRGEEIIDGIMTKIS